MTVVERQWSVDSLLTLIAESHYHALIDVGALITGLDNAQVALQLLQRGLAHVDGVVYLDEKDRKLIVERDPSAVSGFKAARPLEESGLPPERRFTFYDQVHTVIFFKILLALFVFSIFIFNFL